MSQLKQNDDGDIDISSNAFSLVFEQDEIRQRLSQNLKTFLEEWFLDITIGLPYIQLIFVKGTPGSVIADFFKDEILNTVGITGLKSFDPLDLDGATRQLNVDFDATSSFGDIAVNEEVP